MWKVFTLLGCAVSFGFVFCDDQCGANERYVLCPDTMCIPQNCSQRGLPVPCPILGPKGNCPGKPKCICVDNYLRDDSTGVCIPSKKCTTATDATSTETSTGDVTATSEARCGYSSHPPRCGNNEVYNNCSNTACRPYLCSELGFPLKCDKKCKPGCICKDGYVRNDNGVCILINECPSCGGDKNAESGCGNNCGKTCDTYNAKSVVCTRCIVNGCNCRAGFVYDPNVKACVKPEDCTTCNGQNEYFENCIQGCSNQSCSTIGQIFHCPNQPAGQCKSGCRCKPGFFRDGNNVCVSQDDCPKPCGKNEYWEKCVSGCGNQTCDAIGVVWTCPLHKVWQCTGGCQCKPGHWRGPDNVCIPEKDCPTPSCPDGEIWSRCPPVKCDGDYCAKTRDSPQTCPSGTPQCDSKRCVCGLNRKRDRKTGKCIPITDCPPFKCGRNEEYQACPAFCPGENCTDYINKSKCPPGRIGIVLICRPSCKCVKGYYRNTDGVCIPACDCPEESTSISTTTVPPTPGNDGGTSSSDRGTGLTGILDGITAFTGTSLYHRMKSGALENIIMSAMSVFTPIAELCLYSVGTTYDQCIKILNLQNKEDIRKTFPAFISSYEGQSKVNFTTPAKVYANENNPLNDIFIKDVVEVFDAETQDMDFSNSVLAAKIINAWVEDKTNNRIKDLISPDALSALTQLVLVNAIYFKGPWLNQFNPKNTQEDNFYLNDGTTKKVKLMFQLNYFNYGEVPELNCTVAEMFYDGRNSSMVVVLPNSYDGIITLAKKLQDPVNWNKVRASLARARVQLYMPPFEIKTTTDLKELFQAVNLGNWFDPKNSELKGITKKPAEVFVSSAIQKAFIKTDETGSEAAAANAIVVGPTSVQPEPKKFRCDHSFLYYILFKNTPIFSGVVVNP